MKRNIPLFKVYMSKSAPDACADVLRSGWIGQHDKVVEFEKQLAELLGVDMVVATNSATSAEHLALHMFNQDFYKGADSFSGWEPGDEILLSPMTCTATTFPAITMGLRVKWVDIDPQTLNMCLEDLKRKITPRTKIIMPVLWGGIPLDFEQMERVLDYAEGAFGFRPKVIYDCAHALGSTWKGKAICQYPGVFTYSFQAIKHLTSIEGGLLVTHDSEQYKQVKLLRWYGLDRDTKATDFRCGQKISEVGFKMNQVDPNAAVGIENLKDFPYVLQRHRDNAMYYQEALAGVAGVYVLPEHPDAKASYWIYTILVDDRDRFLEVMKDRGIATSRVHERNDIYPVTAEFKSRLPVLDRIDAMRICIPVGWWVTDEEREYIVDSIKLGW